MHALELYQDRRTLRECLEGTHCFNRTCTAPEGVLFSWGCLRLRCLPQVNRVAVWHFDPTASPSPSPSAPSSAWLGEPQRECEMEVTGDVMDMRFLDEERILACLSTGTVTLLRFRPTHKVSSLACRVRPLPYKD